MKRNLSILMLVVLLTANLSVLAQSAAKDPKFKKVKIMLQNGEKISQKPVVVTFSEEKMLIEGKKNGVSKSFKYDDIENAEYSYSKSPRWKTGLGMGAAGIVFPPLLLIAIPLGFTKHRRHWLTIRTGDDYAVLKLSKSNRKIFIPTFETKSGVSVEAIGDEK